MLTEFDLKTAIAALESEMAHLQATNPGVFEFANAWAVRYDALLAETPERSQGDEIAPQVARAFA